MMPQKATCNLCSTLMTSQKFEIVKHVFSFLLSVKCSSYPQTMFLTRHTGYISSAVMFESLNLKLRGIHSKLENNSPTG